MNAPLASPIAEAIICEAIAIAEAVADEMLEEFEREIYLRAAECVQRWEMADPRDAWRHTGDAPPPIERPIAKPVAKYSTPDATQQAFWYVVRLADPERLAAWLDNHRQDEAFLLKLLERK